MLHPFVRRPLGGVLAQRAFHHAQRAVDARGDARSGDHLPESTKRLPVTTLHFGAISRRRSMPQ